ncbi:MAG: sulfotransferase domain-containing protein [Acidobacteriia bacterium]|nr:sulfotransferase domain-containing protein [Terriglobia bacterium]
MIEKSLSAVKSLLSSDPAGRNLRVHAADTFIVSYPKSGNTWMLFLIANLVHPEQPATFLTADRMIPAVHRQTERYFRTLPHPRLIKSHFAFDPNYRRVLYIVRDPRDVVVSQYYYQIKRGHIQEDYPLERYVSRFLAGDVSPYGSWAQHVGSWMVSRHSSPDFLLIRYEDMLAHTTDRLARTARFLGIEPSRERIQHAVEMSSADRMRRIEKVEADKWALTKGSRQDIAFVRSAQAGGWKSAVPADSVAEIESAWGPLMRWLGYELIASAKQTAMDTELLESAMGVSA